MVAPWAAVERSTGISIEASCSGDEDFFRSWQGCVWVLIFPFSKNGVPSNDRQAFQCLFQIEASCSGD